MPLMVNAVLPVLVRITGTGALVVPTVWLGNVTVLGDRLTTVPAPARFTACGLPTELSVTLRVPLSVPATLGLKETETLQLAETARLEPHAFEVTW